MGSSVTIDDDGWLRQYVRQVKIEASMMMKKQRMWLTSLGIVEQDLIQGVMVRLFVLKQRIDNGEHRPELANERTWVVSQIQYALQDEIKLYSWSNPVFIREQLSRLKKGQKLLAFGILQTNDNMCYEVLGSEYIIDQVQTIELMRFVTEYMENSPLRHQYIFHEYFMKERTLKEVSVDLNITESRVSQITTRMVRNLRRVFREHGITCRSGEQSNEQAEEVVHRHNRSEPASDIINSYKEVQYV